MKIGSFVGKENVEFTTEELNTFKTQLIELADKHFGIGAYTIYEMDGVGVGSIHYTIKPKMFDTGNCFALRLKSGDQAKFSNIHISIRKHKGYDEKVVGVCYKWKEGYKPEYNITSFGMSVAVMGDWKGYRRKNCLMSVGINGVHRLWGYDYDTEATQLIGEMTDKIFANTVWEIQNAKPTKTIIDYWK